MSAFTRLPCDEAAMREAQAAAPCARADAPWVLAATILGSGMVFIDGTVANVALPALQQDLGATLFHAQWVVESFQLFLGALLLAGGAAGDRFGRRRAFGIGVVVFTAASLWCGLASGIRELILARAIQGIGGALLVPGSLALISASFAEGERGKAIGTWAGYSAITAALGPVLGGFLIDQLSWRYAFWINVPIGIVVLVLTYSRVPESRNTHAAQRVDWAGAAFATLGLGGTVFALIESSVRGWLDAAVVSAVLLGVACLVAFIAWEKRHPSPMLPLALFKSRDFSGANIVTLLLYAALGGGLFFLPLDLIQVQGYSAAAAGAALLPFVLCMFLLSRWAGGLVERHGAKRPLMLGPLVAGCGFFLFAVPGVGGSYWTTFFPAALILGLGMAVSVAPLTTTVMSSVSPEAAGIASGVNNAVSRVAALLAVALLGIVMSQVFNHELDQRLASASVPAEVRRAVDTQRAKLAAIEIPSGLDSRMRDTLEHAVMGSFVQGFRTVMVLSALLALAAAAITWRMIDGKARHDPG